MHYHFVGLRGYADDIVGLEASHGTRIRITADEARQMKTIEYLLEDVGTEEYIPLPSIAGRTLLQIKAFVSDRRAFFIDTDDDVLNLLKAANYLDFQSLIYHLMPMWVNNPDIFPGPPQLGGYVQEALYFFFGKQFSVLNLNWNVSEPFREFVAENGHNGWNILMAAQNGRLAVVDRLLKDSRVDPSVQENSAITFAAENGHVAVVDRLLKDGRVDPAAKNNYPFRVAVNNGHIKVVNRLLKDDRVDPTAENNDAIRTAAWNGNVEIVGRLLQDGRANPAAHNNVAIQSAAIFGNLKLVEILLQDSRVDPAADNNLAFRLAAQKGHLKVVERLLQDNRVDPTAENNSALRWAAQKSYFEVVERLLEDDRVDVEILKEEDTPELRVLYEKYSRKRQRF